MKKLLFFLLISVQIYAQKQVSLPRSTPEAEGVSSEAILNFVEAASKSKHEFHSYMIVRHGKVIAEGWWNPYRPDLKHTLYSCSKSFAATAIGFAVTEKKLTVEDKVISFFPNDLPDTISENLAALQVRDLLSMSVGNETDPTGAVITSENWVKTFLKYPIKHKPGTKFLYNTAATYMLSAIIQKVTGEKTLDYLKPRLFDPLSIEGMDWEVDPHGISVGGYGLRLKTEDMAKFALLFLQKGKWNGQQILPASWIEEASTMKILQSPDMPQAIRDSSDWQQGYCYQMWRSRHNSYRGDGANGQYMLVLPEHDAVIAITCETQDMQSELNLVWQYLLPAFKKEKSLTSTPSVLAGLKAKNTALAIPTKPKNAISSLENTLNNKVFKFENNDKNLTKLWFDFPKGIPTEKNDVCHAHMQMGSDYHAIDFGAGKAIYGETAKKGPYLVERAVNNRVGLSPYKVMGSYIWKDEKTLELTLQYIESPHTETIICAFENDTVNVDFVTIFNKNAKRTILKGTLDKK